MIYQKLHILCQQDTESAPILKDPEVAKCLAELQHRFGIVPVNKAAKTLISFVRLFMWKF
jgi:hypothetical protein